MENNCYRSKSYHIVINTYDEFNKKPIDEIMLSNFLSKELRFDFYAFIKHCNDVDEEGNKKTPHYHLIVNCNQAYSKNTILNCIASGLECNRDIISVRKMRSLILSVQYLIHKNDKTKFQYSVLDIWSNDIEEVMNIISDDKSKYDFDIKYLIDLCNNCSNLTAVYSVLGLTRSKQYRSLIVDLWKDSHPYL